MPTAQPNLSSESTDGETGCSESGDLGYVILLHSSGLAQAQVLSYICCSLVLGPRDLTLELGPHGVVSQDVLDG